MGIVYRNIFAPNPERIESAQEAVGNAKLEKILRDPIAIVIAIAAAALILANWPK